MLKGMKGQ